MQTGMQLGMQIGAQIGRYAHHRYAHRYPKACEGVQSYKEGFHSGQSKLCLFYWFHGSDTAFS